MPTTRELQNRIEELRKRADPMDQQWQMGSARENVTNIRLEMVALALQLAEISSRRLIYLTWALVALTAGLLALTFVLVRHG
jgi:hypothetical protein